MNEQYKIELSDEAEQDFDNSYQYYEEKSEQTADNFYRSIDESLEKISQNPHGYQEVHEDVRRFVVKRFPFSIYYRIKDIVVRVIAIFHTRRNPEIWQERAENEE